METRMIVATSSSASTITVTKNQLALFASPSKPLDLNVERLGIKHDVNLSFSLNRAGRVLLSTSRKPLIVQARVSEASSSINAFVGGFVLGGIIVGALGCGFAPQISKTLAGSDGKDFMRRLPKFVYDDGKALERTRKILTEKIEQLNAAIDDVSGRLHPEDDSNDLDTNSE